MGLYDRGTDILSICSTRRLERHLHSSVIGVEGQKYNLNSFFCSDFTLFEMVHVAQAPR